MAHLLQDFAPGPLDFYRTKASFDWKVMKLFIHSEDVITYEHELCLKLQELPTKNKFRSSLDEERRVTFLRDQAVSQLEIASIDRVLENPKRASGLVRTLVQFDPATHVKLIVRRNLFGTMLQSLGTERHNKYLEMHLDGTIYGCFCLTEIGHGSNTKGLRTTATYDINRGQYVLNTPDFEAAKCWAGALGQTATFAIVYAQLYLRNVNYGLHAFLVPIRDPKSLIPYPGLVVGDMGEKIGLNGIDNGFLLFDNYYIPRENLLNKNSDVTEDGQYITPFKKESKTHSASFKAVSFSRIYISATCEGIGTNAITTAIRYAAVRKQFGPNDKEEVPILEYQSHQYRLLPYLAATYSFRILNIYLGEEAFNLMIEGLTTTNKEELADRNIEFHVLSSAIKPLAGWMFRDAIQECREACGGHGYLKAAGFGDLRDNNDANNTYEGENSVIIQQTSNWLIKTWISIKSGKSIKSNLHSVDFLTDAFKILQLQFSAESVSELCRPETIIQAFQWLTCYLLKETFEKINRLTPEQGDFWSKNNTQVFYANSLALSFVQHYMLQHMILVMNKANDLHIHKVLLKLFALFGLWSLQKHLGTLYEGGYIQQSESSRLFKEGILHLCSEIKDDAVALVDAIAPPDFILNSVLGNSDGQVYKHLQSAFFQSPQAFSRPSWWKDIVEFKSVNASKL